MTEKTIQDECQKLADLLIRKNHDYGDSAGKAPYLVPGMSPDSAILVRMSDKIERLRNVCNNNELPRVGETIDDTIRDLAGYCILFLALGPDY